jgi:hypothetical protein
MRAKNNQMRGSTEAEKTLCEDSPLLLCDDHMKKMLHCDHFATLPMPGNPRQGGIVFTHVRQPTARRPCPCQATTPTSEDNAHTWAIKILSATKDTLFYFLFLCALKLLGAAHGLTRRGWTSCPTRARPSWVMRGACLLHNLIEVGRTWKVTSLRPCCNIDNDHLRRPTARCHRLCPRQATHGKATTPMSGDHAQVRRLRPHLGDQDI